MDAFREYFLSDQKPSLTVGINLNPMRFSLAVNWAKTENLVKIISVNKEICNYLIRKSVTNVPQEINEWISRNIKRNREELLLITNIEILFEPDYDLDPMFIFKQVSRNSPLLVLWPGEYKDYTLSYASPEHAHYRTWVNPGVQIITV